MWYRSGTVGNTGGTNLNIFTQLTEPDIKDGIWIKTDGQYERVVADGHILSGDMSWSEIMTASYTLNYGACQIYKGEIHVFFNKYFGKVDNNHGIYDIHNDTMTFVGDIPFSSAYSCSVEWNNEIHAFSDTNGGSHYKYDGTAWTSVGKSPINACGSDAVVFNNEIHLLGEGSGGSGTEIGSKDHYRYDGNAWTSVGDLPYEFGANNKQSVVFNGEIHIMGSHITSAGKLHYKYDGNAWTSVSTLPIDLNGDATVFIYNGYICFIRGDSFYKFDGVSWTLICTLPIINNGSIVLQKDEMIRIANGKSYSIGNSIENTYEANTFIIERADVVKGNYVTCFLNTPEISGDHNRFATGFNDAWYLDETGIDHDSEMYYGDGTQWIKFKN